MFNDNITMASSSDDTKPLVDKKNQSRYGDEPSGQQVFKPHGNYMVKDRFFYLKVEAAKVPIKEIVKGYLKEQRDTVLTKIKRYNPFIDEKEQSYDLMKTKAPTPKDNKITEKVKEVKNLDEDRNNEQTEEITLNIMLDVLETTNKRKNQLQIEDKERNKSVNPNTSKGQLGNGD
jgi:hypothetical protein